MQFSPKPKRPRNERKTMGKRPLTQFQVGYNVSDGEDGYSDDDDKHKRSRGQHERVSDVHGEISPVPPIRRMAPPRVARQSPAATRPKQEPINVKDVVTLHAPREENPWTKGRYEKVYVTQDFDGDATVAVGAQRVVLIRQFPRPNQHTVQLHLQLRHRNVVEVIEAFYHQDLYYMVMEEMTLCLHHFVRCPTLPSHEQLRSILVQAWPQSAYLPSPLTYNSRYWMG